jgi:tetratricopeptide (TPR) repeat protein
VLAGFALVLSLAQAAPSPPAYGAARPAECGIAEGLRSTNGWERAKEPQLRAYCELLARGTAHLVASPGLVKEVIDLAAQADKLLPGRAAPKVLEGRALLRLGRASDALAALAEAKKRDDRALDDPVALLAWARANARTGHAAEAAQAYRAALPRTSALSTAERTAASFEAGMVVMAQGGKGIDDAIAMFRQARRDAQDSMQVASVVALALALDRAGLHDESKAVLAERVRADARGVLSDARVTDALADAGLAWEIDALLGTALEPVDPAAAQAAWRRYVEGQGGKGAWADHARAREAPHGGAKNATGAKKKEHPR